MVRRVINWPRKFRPLYLLALFQLVAGPLVLLQVTVFCKLTVRETPEHGFTYAASLAWQSPEFQSALCAADRPGNDAKSQLPTPDPEGKDLKAKLPVIAWCIAPMLASPASRLAPRSDWARTWSPILPIPPPGPPPRVG